MLALFDFESSLLVVLTKSSKALFPFDDGSVRPVHHKGNEPSAVPSAERNARSAILDGGSHGGRKRSEQDYTPACSSAFSHGVYCTQASRSFAL